MKKEQKEKDKKELEQKDLQAKIKVAQERARKEYNRHLEQVEQIRIQREKEEAERLAKTPPIVYKGRKPSIDSFGRAIDGIGVEFKIVGMKYRSFDEQIHARCLEPGDSVLLKPEINPFSETEAMAVYTLTKFLVGYVVTEQSQKAKDMMFREYLQAFVKIPWEVDRSWFLVVVPEQN